MEIIFQRRGTYTEPQRTRLVTIVPSRVMIRSPSNTWFLGPTRVLSTSQTASGSQSNYSASARAIQNQHLRRHQTAKKRRRRGVSSANNWRCQLGLWNSRARRSIQTGSRVLQVNTRRTRRTLPVSQKHKKHRGKKRWRITWIK